MCQMVVKILQVSYRCQNVLVVKMVVKNNQVSNGCKNILGVN